MNIVYFVNELWKDKQHILTATSILVCVQVQKEPVSSRIRVYPTPFYYSCIYHEKQIWLSNSEYQSGIQCIC